MDKMLKQYKLVMRDIKSASNKLISDIIDELNDKFNYDFDISLEVGELPIIHLDRDWLLDGSIVRIYKKNDYIFISVKTLYDVFDLTLSELRFTDLDYYIELYEYMMNNIREVK